MDSDRLAPDPVLSGPAPGEVREPGRDRVFEMSGATVRYGPGVTGELGAELADRGLRRVLVVTDPVVATLPPVASALASLDAHGVDHVLFDRVRAEPTDRSFQEAIAAAAAAAVEAFVAVGGGSVIDTAKAANLYTTHPPADFLDYVNPPIGRGIPVPGPLRPLFAIPTTAGTGSETTGVAIFDLEARHLKTGISSRYLRPTLGMLDPDHTRTLPPAVAASCGLDILCHAVESFTALPFTARPRPPRPSARPPYQGANPISDLWALEALRLVSTHLVRAVEDPHDDQARAAMVLAATLAGIGFGNAGVHLPHAMSYPVAGGVRDYRVPGYPPDRPLVPHGFSVIVNAPAVFALTAAASPERHLQAAAALGADVAGRTAADAGPVLADRIAWFMDRLGAPAGLSAIGYGSGDVATLVEGAMAQRRLTVLSPVPVDADVLGRLFERALRAW